MEKKYKRTIYDRIKMAVAKRDDAYYEAYDALKEAVEKNRGFVSTQTKSGRPLLSALVWDGYVGGYASTNVHALRVKNGVLECFCDPSWNIKFPKKDIEHKVYVDQWFGLDENDERIYSMLTVFEALSCVNIFKKKIFTEETEQQL